MFIDSGIGMGFARIQSCIDPQRRSIACDPNGPHSTVTVGMRRGMFNGTVTLFKRAADMLAAEGKFLTVSLKDHFSSINKTGGGTSGGILCDPSESDNAVYNFTARRTNCFNETWCDCWPYGEEVPAWPV